MQPIVLAQAVNIVTSKTAAELRYYALSISPLFTIRSIGIIALVSQEWRPARPNSRITDNHLRRSNWKPRRKMLNKEYEP